MNTCTYHITPFSYSPSVKKKTMQERKMAFKKKLRQWASKNDLDFEKYPKWLRKDFFEYWTELANDNGRKMRFEMEKSWNTGRRLATAKKTIYAKDPRWTERPSNIDYGIRKRFKPNQMSVVTERLTNKFDLNK